MYIQTEATPNPNAIKFIPGIDISPSSTVFYTKIENTENSFLAKKLFSVKGVKNIFFGSNFITVTKDEDSEWEILKREIIICIVDHFNSGLRTFNDEYEHKNLHKPEENNAANIGNITEIEKQIIEIIDTKVRPAVAMDGGDIIYKSFNEGIVTLELKGACSGCPSSTITLKNGIESMLKHYIPEVKEVEAYEENS